MEAVMASVRIHIPDKDESARAFVALARDDRIACLPNDVYIVPETALGTLRRLGVTFQQLGPGGNGHAAAAIRSAAADQVQ
jgi:hypothetical protein